MLVADLPRLGMDSALWLPRGKRDLHRKAHPPQNISQVTDHHRSVGLMKCVTYGGAIAIISSHRGLVTFGGSEGVGWATTTAVVNSSFGIIVLNFLLSVMGYFLIPP